MAALDYWPQNVYSKLLEEIMNEARQMILYNFESHGYTILQPGETYWYSATLSLWRDVEVIACGDHDWIRDEPNRACGQLEFAAVTHWANNGNYEYSIWQELVDNDGYENYIEVPEEIMHEAAQDAMNKLLEERDKEQSEQSRDPMQVDQPTKGGDTFYLWLDNIFDLRLKPSETSKKSAPLLNEHY